MRITREKLYMEISNLFSQRSTCGRLQVGCTIVKDGRIICSGYNGALKDNILCDKCNCDLSKPCEKAVHAEANAISYAAKMGIALEGSTIYVTHSPCIKCAELIIQAGIEQVIYKEEFRNREGLLLLYNNKVNSKKYAE